MVKILLEFGANVNATGSTILFASINHLNQVEAWDKKGGCMGDGDELFPLFIAVLKSNCPVVEELLKSGADIHQTNSVGHTAFHRACMNFDDSFNLYGVGLETIETPERSVIALLLRHGADIHRRDNYGKTPLHHGCQHYSTNTALFLLENGADVDINVEDRFGRTPLLIAALKSFDMTMCIISKLSKGDSLTQLSQEAMIEAYECVALCHDEDSPVRGLRIAARICNSTKCIGIIISG